MPVTEATLPIRMNSGTTTNSAEEASVKLSEAIRLIAAFRSLSTQMPAKPTENIASATGTRITNSTNRTARPIRPTSSPLIR